MEFLSWMSIANKIFARRRVLSEWRRIDLVPLEEEARNSSRPASVVVQNVLAELRMDRRRGEAEILKVWNFLIDPVVTAHAQPVGIAKGTVFVDVDSSVWLDEIVRFRRKEILERLQHAFGKEMVGKISFRLG